MQTRSFPSKGWVGADIDVENNNTISWLNGAPVSYEQQINPEDDQTCLALQINSDT